MKNNNYEMILTRHEESSFYISEWLFVPTTVPVVSDTVVESSIYAPYIGRDTKVVFGRSDIPEHMPVYRLLRKEWPNEGIDGYREFYAYRYTREGVVKILEFDNDEFEYLGPRGNVCRKEEYNTLRHEWEILMDLLREHSGYKEFRI